MIEAQSFAGRSVHDSFRCLVSSVNVVLQETSTLDMKEVYGIGMTVTRGNPSGWKQV